MKVLMSAYACEPDKGSEPGTGWAWARAAAIDHELWLLTRSNNRGPIESELMKMPGLRIHPVYIDLPSWARWWKRGHRGVRLYYMLWQSKARRVARALHEEHQFDLAHHITFATDWLPAGVIGIDGLPSVWGPVGGAAPFPWGLRRYLGWRGTLDECARVVTGGLGRRLFGDRAARNASVVVAQNEEVANRFAHHRPIVEPHVALPSSSLPDDHSDDIGIDLLFVGRLLPWKGVAVAIHALAEPGMDDRTLTVLGKGRDERRLAKLAHRLGVTDRVRFIGQLPREDVARYLTSARLVAFLSVHDSAPWALAEAVAASRPIVALASCGPRVIVERAGGGITVDPSPAAASAAARAILLARPPERPDIVFDTRLPALLDRWYGSATQTRPASV